MKLGITFDLWLTLIGEIEGGSQSVSRNLLRSEITQKKLLELKENISIEVITNSYKEISSIITSRHNHGEDKNYYKSVSDALNLMSPGISERIGLKEVENIGLLIDSAFLKIPPYIYNDTKSVLNEIHLMGFEMGLISNTGLTSPDTYRKWFNNEGLSKYFSVMMFSNEIGIAKPKDKIFLKTLEIMKIDPNFIMHIGDNLLTDIFGASQIGINTTWLSGQDNRKPITKPNFTISRLNEFPELVRNWRTTLIS